MRLTLPLVLAVFTLGCGGSTTDVPIEVQEVELPSDASGGLSLEREWLGFQVPTANLPTGAMVMLPDGGGSVLRFLVYERPGAANGGLLRDMAFERQDVGASDVLRVIHPSEALCQSSDCPTPLRAAMKPPVLLRDGDLLVGAQLLSWGEPFTPRQRLLRFSADGGLRWSAPLDAPALVEPGPVAELADGALVAAFSLGGGQSSPGVRFELHTADGALAHSTSLDRSTIADSGAGLPANSVPIINALVPSRSGGFFALGVVDLNRDIRCGSQDAPEKPDGLVCGQSISHALVAKFDGTGALQWQRRFGHDFEAPGSHVDALLELDDGSLVVTGAIEKRTTRWLQPEFGALVARLSATGEVLTATRVCPCVDFDSGGSGTVLSNPRLASGRAVDALYRSPTATRTLLRFNEKNVVVGAAPWPTDAARFDVVSTEFGWAYWTSTNPEEVNHVRAR